jgi:hypothetical protein
VLIYAIQGIIWTREGRKKVRYEALAAQVVCRVMFKVAMAYLARDALSRGPRCAMAAFGKLIFKPQVAVPCAAAGIMDNFRAFPHHVQRTAPLRSHHLLQEQPRLKSFAYCFRNPLISCFGSNLSPCPERLHITTQWRTTQGSRKSRSHLVHEGLRTLCLAVLHTQRVVRKLMEPARPTLMQFGVLDQNTT